LQLHEVPQQLPQLEHSQFEALAFESVDVAANTEPIASKPATAAIKSLVFILIFLFSEQVNK